MNALVTNWDELSGETITTEHFMTRGDDDKLIAELREFTGDEQEDGVWSWELVGIVHLPKTTLVEWRSDRDHHATTTICWAEAKSF